MKEWGYLIGEDISGYDSLFLDKGMLWEWDDRFILWF